MGRRNRHILASTTSRRAFFGLLTALAMVLAILTLALVLVARKNPTHNELKALLVASEEVQHSAEARAAAVQLLQGQTYPIADDIATEVRAADALSRSNILNAQRSVTSTRSKARMRAVLDTDAAVAASNERILGARGPAGREEFAEANAAQTVLIQQYAQAVGASSHAIRQDIIRSRQHEESLDRLLTYGLILAGILGIALLMTIARRFVLSARREDALTRDLVGLQRLHELMLASVDEGVIALDMSATVVFANPAAENLTQRPHDQMLGLSCQEALQFLDDASVLIPPDECGVLDLVRRGASGAIVGRCVRADGSVFFAEVTVNPIWVNGEIDGTVLLVRDITERHDAEKTKDDLLAVVGHELRTPLTSIRGSLGILASGAAGALDTDAQRLITIASGNTDRLARIVDDLLDMGQLDNRRMRLELHPTRIHDLCGHVMEAHLESASRSDVTVLCEHDSDVTCIIDSDRIVRVLSNLIDNAIRVSPAGSNVDVDISTTEDDHCRITVIDDGPGVPAEERERIFDRFAQIDSGDARRSGGLGLGLAICREIVELHAGTITVTDAPGRGAMFVVELPLAGPPAERLDSADLPVEAAGA